MSSIDGFSRSDLSRLADVGPANAGVVSFPVPPVGTSNTYTGTTGDDTETGTSGDDVFNMYQSGHDTVYGGDGNDEIHFGRFFAAGDVVRGGSATDSLFISGSTYAGGLSITSTMLLGVEQITLGGGNDYTLTIGDGVIAAGAQLYVNGYSAGAGHSVNIDASAETNGTVYLAGSYGNDTLKGGTGNDLLYSSPFATDGGSDKMYGGDGTDYFSMGPSLDPTDQIYGGAGTGDYIGFDGDYSAGLTLGVHVTGIESLDFYGGYDYRISTVDQNVASGVTLNVDSSSLGGGHWLNFNGATESNGHFDIVTGPGDDILTGGSQSDLFDLGEGGKDTAYGGAGDDTFKMEAEFSGGDSLHGGAGSDTVELSSADYDQTISGAMISDIEEISMLLGGGHSYSLKTTDDAVAAGDTLLFRAPAADPTHSVSVNGSAETDGSLEFIGGLGDDTFRGGAKADTFQGGDGADTLTGGGGNDVFFYLATVDSTGPAFDTITDFDTHPDKFLFTGGVTAIDHKVKTGTLSQATFNHDLGSALGVHHLGAHHAVIFSPDSGDYAGSTFLVVDGNGTAGYQSGVDYVVELTHPANLGDLSTANFI